MAGASGGLEEVERASCALPLSEGSTCARALLSRPESLLRVLPSRMRWRMQCCTATWTDGKIQCAPILSMRPERESVSSTRLPTVEKASRMSRALRSRCMSSSMCSAVLSMEATAVISMTM